MPINEELLSYRIFCIIESYSLTMTDDLDYVQACTDDVMSAVLEELGLEDDA